MRGMMSKLKLTVNEAKTHVCRMPQDTFDFLGYTFGRLYSPRTGGAYLGARPSRKRVVRVCEADQSQHELEKMISHAEDCLQELGLAYRVKNIISFGVTGKYIMRSIAGYNAAAFGGDAALLATPGEHFRIGAGIFNVGQQIQFISVADPLPMTGRMGLAYQILDVPHHSLMISADGSYQIQAQAFQAGVGGEYWFDKTFALRGGYTGDAYQQHWTAGVGLNLNVFQLDYAYAPAGTLGDTHRISVNVVIGGPLIMPEAYVTASPAFILGQQSLRVNFATKSEEPIDHYKITILDPSGMLVKTFEGKGTPPSTYLWDGRNQAGTLVPQGNYTINMEVTNDEELTAKARPREAFAKWVEARDASMAAWADEVTSRYR